MELIYIYYNLFIICYNFLLIKWFVTNKYPNVFCNIGLYVTMLYGLSCDFLCAENTFFLLLLSVYLLLLLFMFNLILSQHNDGRKSFNLLLICVITFNYFIYVDKLDLYSVSLAFFSCFFYNWQGIRWVQAIVDYYFRYYETYFFSNKLRVIAKLVHLSVKIIHDFSMWESKIKNKILKRVLISITVWISIYYLKSLLLFFFINLILLFFLFINSIFLYTINNYYIFLLLFDQLTDKEFSETYERIYVLFILETNEKTKDQLKMYGTLACAFDSNSVTYLKMIFNEVFGNLSEENKVDKFYKDLVIYLCEMEKYNNLAVDIRMLEVDEYISSKKFTDEEIMESNFFFLFKQLEFSKEKLLINYVKELEIRSDKIMDSSLLLVIKTPVWYININFPLIQMLCI